MDIFKWLFPIKTAQSESNNGDVTCSELAAFEAEYAVRSLAFNTAVNMIANYVSQCEFKTYRDRRETREREYYKWNIEPNKNQNKTAFINKLIYQLMLNNEALIIETGSGEETGYVVADEFTLNRQLPVRGNVYEGVVVGDFQYKKNFAEKDVIHLKLQNEDIKAVTDALYSSYYKLIKAAQDKFEYNAGSHWKVHVDSIAQGREGFLDEFTEMITKQFKPFLNSNKAVLPEFDGYTFTNTDQSSNTRSTTGESADIRNLIDDVFEFTGRAFGIPAVLLKGSVENTEGAETRFYTRCDGIIAQLSEEITRKAYGYEAWRKGSYILIDSSSVLHFDMLRNAANVEKLVGSGAFSVNEVRKAAGQPVINEPWADRHFMTKNIGDIGELTGDGKGGST